MAVRESAAFAPSRRPRAQPSAGVTAPVRSHARPLLGLLAMSASGLLASVLWAQPPAGPSVPSAPSAAPRAPAAAPLVPSAPPVLSPHPLLAQLVAPDWLASREALTLVRPAPREVAVDARFTAALLAAVAPHAPSTSVRVVTSADVSPVALATAARASGHDTAVGLQLHAEQQRVRLRAVFVDLRTQPPGEHVSEVVVPLDVFLARMVGGPPAVRGSAVRARALRFQAAGLLGLDIADVDQDGRLELLVAREPHVSVYTLTQEGAQLRLARRGRAPWPRAPLKVPRTRRTEAWFSVQAGRVVVSRSDREGEYALTLSGDALGFGEVASACPGGQRFSDGCGHWVPGRDYFAGALEPLATARRRPAANTNEDDDEAEDDPRHRAPRFYARSLRGLWQADGRALVFEALVTPRGSLVAQVGGRRAAVGGQGAALAGADVDADGALDVLTSDYTREGQDDRLRWFRLGSEGHLGLVWEGAQTAGAIVHATAGDLLGTGRPLFVAFEARQGGGSRLWVVD